MSWQRKGISLTSASTLLEAVGGCLTQPLFNFKLVCSAASAVFHYLFNILFDSIQGQLPRRFEVVESLADRRMLNAVNRNRPRISSNAGRTESRFFMRHSVSASFMKPQHLGDSLQEEHQSIYESRRKDDAPHDDERDLVLSDVDDTGHSWLLCHLDSSDDPVLVLHQLRQCIGGTPGHSGAGAALLEVNDSNPSVALDAILLLCLLESDLETQIIFRPLTYRAESGCLLLRVCKLKQKKGKKQDHQRSMPVVKVKCSVNPSSSDMLRDVRALADSLLSKVNQHNVACIKSESPTQLIVALRALKIARKVIRSERSDQDLFINPRVSQEEKGVCFHAWIKSTREVSEGFP